MFVWEKNEQLSCMSVWEVEETEYEYMSIMSNEEWKQTVKELVVPCPFYKCLSSPRVLLY